MENTTIGGHEQKKRIKWKNCKIKRKNKQNKKRKCKIKREKAK